MPLTELMNYFNDQLQMQVISKNLPRTGLYKANNTYWARFGSLTLGSQFHAIQQLNSDDALGYEAELIVRASTGNLLNIDSIFNSLDDHDQIVHLDRLVRTLHSLNYLQKFDGQENTLSLEVQPRHIVSVADDHGKTFEAILSDCGLKPERVLLHTRLLNQTSLPHFYKALSNYRNRGYRIGIRLTQNSELTLLANLGLAPDVVFLHYPELEWIIDSQENPNNKIYLEPIELREAQRILVTHDQLPIHSLPAYVDGYLITPHKVLDSAEILLQVNS